MGASYMSHHLCLYKICVTCSLVSEEEADQIFFFISSSLIAINIYAICCSFGLCVVFDKLGGLFSFLEREWISDMCQVYQPPFVVSRNIEGMISSSSPKKVFKICLCLIIRNETLKNGTDYILKFFVCNSSFSVNYPPHQNLLLQSIFPPLVRESIYRDMTCANLKFFPPLMILISKL